MKLSSRFERFPNLIFLFTFFFCKKRHQTVDGHKDLIKNFKTKKRKSFIRFREKLSHTKLRSSPGSRISTVHESSFLLELILLSLDKRFMKVVRLLRLGDSLC